MAHEKDVNRTYKTMTNWIIFFGVAGFALLWWFAAGRPGAPLSDGTYDCRSSWHVGSLADGPAADVSGGRVADAWTFDLSSGTSSSVPFGNVEKTSYNEFTMDSVQDFTGDTTKFVCKLN